MQHPELLGPPGQYTDTIKHTLQMGGRRRSFPFATSARAGARFQVRTTLISSGENWGEDVPNPNFKAQP